MKHWTDFIAQAEAIVSAYRTDAPPGFDPKNFEGWGAIIAGTVAAAGVGASIAASSSASDAASQANSQNAANVADTNQLNYQQFLQARGSTGSAIYPIYASGSEQQLYNDATSAYNATGGSNLPTLAQYQAMVDQSRPAAQVATQAVNGVFNGATQGQELGNAAPVQAANLALAQTQKQSSLEALQQTLNNIKSIQAGKGYSGDSFTNQLLNYQARQGANTQGAQAIAGANLANTQITQGIQQNAINRQLANVNLPGQIAQNNINLAQAPTNALNQNQVNRQNLFANFKIGTSQPFQYTPPPLTTPVAGTGQLVAQGVGAAANIIGNQYATNQLINALNSTTTPALPPISYSGSNTSAAGYTGTAPSLGASLSSPAGNFSVPGYTSDFSNADFGAFA